MRKKIYFIISIVFVILLVFCFYYYKKSEIKVSINEYGFKLAAQDFGYKILDATEYMQDKYNAQGYMTKFYAAVSDKSQIHFIEYSDEQLTVNSYIRMAKDIKNSSNKMNIKQRNGKNYRLISFTSKDEYQIICGVDNTIIIAKGLVQDKSRMNKVFNKFGYGFRVL